MRQEFRGGSRISTRLKLLCSCSEVSEVTIYKTSYLEKIV